MRRKTATKWPKAPQMEEPFQQVNGRDPRKGIEDNCRAVFARGKWKELSIPSMRGGKIPTLGVRKGSKKEESHLFLKEWTRPHHHPLVVKPAGGEEKARPMGAPVLPRKEKKRSTALKKKGRGILQKITYMGWGNNGMDRKGRRGGGGREMD